MHLAVPPGVSPVARAKRFRQPRFQAAVHDDQAGHSFHDIASARRLRGRSAELSPRWRGLGRRGLFGAIARQLAAGPPPSSARNSFFSAELFVHTRPRTEDDQAARQALDEWLRERPEAGIIVAAIDWLPDDTLDVEVKLSRLTSYQLIGLVQALLQQAIDWASETPGVELDPDFERLQRAKALLEGESAPELLQ
jgi:hypothetical protein